MKKKVQQTSQPVPENNKNSTSPDSDKESELGENRCRITEYRTELNNLWEEMMQFKKAVDKKWEVPSKEITNSNEILPSSTNERNIKKNAVINEKSKEMSKQKPVNNNKKKMPVVSHQKLENSLTVDSKNKKIDSKNKKNVLKTAKQVAKNNIKDKSKKGL